MKDLRKKYNIKSVPSYFTNALAETQYEDDIHEKGLIPVGKYFRYGMAIPHHIVEFVSRKWEESNHDVDIFNEIFPNKSRVIPVDRIVPTQEHLVRSKINKKFGKPPEPSIFIEYAGRFFLLDGHHRVVSRIIENKQVKGYVYKLTKKDILL